MKGKVVMQSQKFKHYFQMFYLMMLSFAMIIVAGISGKVINLILQSNKMNFTIYGK